MNNGQRQEHFTNEGNDNWRKISPSELIDKFERSVEGTLNEWKACCPLHEDTKRSLSIRFEGRKLRAMECERGCSPESILRAVGLQFSDLDIERLNP